MATPSARSFNQYSGINRFKQQQKSIFGDEAIPSAFDRMQDPKKYAPGSDADLALKEGSSWALPLSERPATPVGRSFYDPERQAERVIRGTARPGQLQGAMIRQNLQQPMDEFDQIMQDQVGQGMGDTTDYGSSQGRGPIRKPYMGYNPSGRNLVNSAISGRRPSFF